MLSRKLAPILHSIRTFPSMILESLHIPFHIVRQESDWKKLCDLFSGLDQYPLQEGAIQDLLKPAYHDYISNFSAPSISLSLNRASFLFFFTRLMQAQNILDLGSGFSSYVFRLSAQQTNHVVVTSVDDSEFWLRETKRFLEKYNLDDLHLWSLNQYLEEHSAMSTQDLCFLDMGDIGLRQRLLPGLLSNVYHNKMVLIVDDFHVPTYRNFVTNLCEDKKVHVYSLRKVTRRRLSHMALIIGS